MTRLITIIFVILALVIPWHYPQSKPAILKTQTIDYPAIWRDAPTNSLVDNWGYRNRICASYVAYKIWETFNINAVNWGDGYGWVAQAKAHGYTVNNTPSAHAVIVYLYAPGHVQWIDHMNKDGTVHITQYDGSTGNYSEQDFDATSKVLFPYGLNIIHFN